MRCRCHCRWCWWRSWPWLQCARNATMKAAETLPNAGPSILYIYINPGTHAIIIYTRKINVYIYNWHYIAYNNNNNNSTAERENRRERKNVNDLDFPSGPRYIIPRRAMKAISVKHFDAFSWFLFLSSFLSLFFSAG
jgi:hypothetical protein